MSSIGWHYPLYSLSLFGSLDKNKCYQEERVANSILLIARSKKGMVILVFSKKTVHPGDKYLSG